MLCLQFLAVHLKISKKLQAKMCTILGEIGRFLLGIQYCAAREQLSAMKIVLPDSPYPLVLSFFCLCRGKERRTTIEFSTLCLCVEARSVMVRRYTSTGKRLKPVLRVR